MNDLTRLAATEIAAGVRAKTLAAVDVADAFADRIDEIDGAIGAFAALRDRDQIRQGAQRVADRGDLAELPLAGVPIAIKDNIRVSGLPCRFGSRATSPAPSTEDDEVVRRVKAAGAVVLGTTTMPELALLAFTEALVYGGPTRNPWNLERIPGGSSGGSAAAVAARMAPIAIGSDGLGSIRIPCACCGLFGIKPGFGLLPQAAIGNWFGQSELGPLATTVDDAALLLGVLAGETVATEAPRRRKIAVWTRSSALGIGVDPQIRDAIHALAGRLEELGHDVHHVKTPRSTSIAYALLRRWWAFAADDAQTLGLDIDLLEPITRAYVSRGHKVLNKGAPSDREVQKMRRALAGTFDHYDLVVSPVVAQPPLLIDERRGRFFGLLFRQTKFAPFTAMWNLAQYPAAALPIGTDRDGLPIGAMIAGPPETEPAILSLARQLEEQQPWERHAPS